MFDMKLIIEVIPLFILSKLNIPKMNEINISIKIKYVINFEYLIIVFIKIT